MNAFTTKEHTAFYVRLLADSVDLGPRHTVGNHLGPGPAGGRARSRAAGDPRGNTHARRRAGRRGPRPVQCGSVPGPPARAGRAGPGVDGPDYEPRAGGRVPPAPLPDGQRRRDGGRENRPRPDRRRGRAPARQGGRQKSAGNCSWAGRRPSARPRPPERKGGWSSTGLPSRLTSWSGCRRSNGTTPTARS